MSSTPFQAEILKIVSCSIVSRVKRSKAAFSIGKSINQFEEVASQLLLLKERVQSISKSEFQLVT